MTISENTATSSEPPLRRLTREEARVVVAQWRKSGLTAQMFAPSVQVSAQTIYQWASDFRKEKRRIKKKQRPEPALQRIQIPTSVESTTTPDCALTIVLTTPPRIELQDTVPESLIRAAVQAVLQ